MREWVEGLLHTRQSFALFRYLFKILSFFVLCKPRLMPSDGWAAEEAFLFLLALNFC